MIGKFKDYYKKKAGASKSPMNTDGPLADDVEGYLNSELLISPGPI